MIIIHIVEDIMEHNYILEYMNSNRKELMNGNVDYIKKIKNYDVFQMLITRVNINLLNIIMMLSFIKHYIGVFQSTLFHTFYILVLVIILNEEMNSFMIDYNKNLNR